MVGDSTKAHIHPHDNIWHTGKHHNSDFIVDVKLRIVIVLREFNLARWVKNILIIILTSKCLFKGYLFFGM